jgi:type II secretory pathway pseudopilin PulG
VTLLEVLIVLAIVTLLAGILMPMLGWIRTRVQQTACINNLRQVGAAVRLYAALEGGRAPASQNWGEPRPERSSAWFHRLPAMTGEGRGARTGTIYQCPSSTGRLPGLLRNEVPKSYKMNVELDRRKIQGRYWHSPFRLDLISDAADVVLFVDAIATGGKAQWGYATPKEVDDSRHPGWVGALFSDGRTARVAVAPAADLWDRELRWLSVDWGGDP